MRIITPLFISVCLLLNLDCLGQQGVIIEGHVEDGQEAYINLNYNPWQRGNLNFEGFRSVGTYLNQEGKFCLEATHIVHAAKYGIDFPGNHIPLYLFDGDSIYLNTRFSDLSQTFATGKGAGKINVLFLDQFQQAYDGIRKKQTLDGVVSYLDSVTHANLSLLSSIYSKKIKDDAVPNVQQIQTIIDQTPLTIEEYSFLKTHIKFQRYIYQTEFLAQKSKQSPPDSTSIDFNAKAFQHFNIDEYRQLDHINDWTMYRSLVSILQIEYLKHKQQEGVDITFANYRSQLRSPDAMDWVHTFLPKHFNRDITNRYYAGFTTSIMTLGFDHTPYSKFLDLTESNKYSQRIKQYQHYLDNGLENEIYKLNSPAKEINAESLQELINFHSEKPVLFVFWSAQFAGATLMDKLPGLRAFEKDQQAHMQLIYICVDRMAHKKLWAARILDESWKANHYFLPIEGNNETLKQFGNPDIASFCSGGAFYAFINKEGSFQNGIVAPYNLRKGEIRQVYK